MTAGLERIRTFDDWLAIRLNAAGRGSAGLRLLVGTAAAWLAGAEVVLMVGLALAGRRGSAGRMLAGVGAVYIASEMLGRAWQRERPFVRLSLVESLVPHTAGRSFPSRHVASGLTMATVGYRAHPLLGAAMAVVAAVLGISRVAAGLHYPSDVLVGAALGVAVGRCLRG